MQSWGAAALNRRDRRKFEAYVIAADDRHPVGNINVKQIQFANKRVDTLNYAIRKGNHDVDAKLCPIDRRQIVKQSLYKLQAPCSKIGIASTSPFTKDSMISGACCAIIPSEPVIPLIRATIGLYRL